MSDSPIYRPPVAYYFKLGFTGISSDTDAAFQEAAGISMELEVQEQEEGGENRYRHKLPKPAKYSNLTLKRGEVLSGSQLAKWCQETIGGNFENPIKPKAITVSLLDVNSKNGDTLMSWNFVNAYPIKWSISDLKSNDNALVIESMEFAYDYFTQSS